MHAAKVAETKNGRKAHQEFTRIIPMNSMNWKHYLQKHLFDRNDVRD
jgi:hypothetical protein